jgi:predicted RNase H-like HicB family nuclease
MNFGLCSAGIIINGNPLFHSGDVRESTMKSLTTIFKEAEEGGYVGWLEAIPEVVSQGETMEETKTNLIDALNLLMETNEEETETIFFNVRLE